MNAELELSIERMTVAEKMEVVDLIMSDLSKNSSAIPEIGWHGEVLRKRAEDLSAGRDRFLTLEQAEARIRAKTGR